MVMLHQRDYQLAGSHPEWNVFFFNTVIDIVIITISTFINQSSFDSFIMTPGICDHREMILITSQNY